MTATAESEFQQLIEDAVLHRNYFLTWPLRKLGRYQDAEDVFGDAVLSAWKHAGQFDRRRATFRTWFSHIVRNRTIDFIRKRKKGLDMQSNCFEKLDGYIGTTDSTSVSQEMEQTRLNRTAACTAIAQAPEGDQQALELIYGRGFTWKNAARDLGKPEGSIKSSIHRVKHLLRERV